MNGLFYFFVVLCFATLGRTSFIEVTVIIENNSHDPIHLVNCSLASGVLISPPPTLIPGGQSLSFRANSSTFLKGVDLSALYSYRSSHNSPDSTVLFRVEAPFAGSNKCFSPSLPWTGSIAVCSVTQGRTPTVHFSFVWDQPHETEFLIFGHAGSPLTSCENTIPSFRDALNMGANAIELDLSITSDNQLIAWHDWDPNSVVAEARQIGGEGYLCRPWVPDKGDAKRLPTVHQTLEVLRKYNGYTKTKFIDAQKCKQRCPSGDEKCKYECAKPTDDIIPTFDEFCAAIGTDPRVKYLFLDTKIPKGWHEDNIRAFTLNIFTVLTKYQIVHKALFASPEDDVHQIMHKKLAELSLTFHSMYDMNLPQVIIPDPSKYSSTKHAVAEGVDFASIGKPRISVDPAQYFALVMSDTQDRNVENLKRSQAHRMRYITWTINSRSDMQKLIVDSGVDGIVTDRVDVAVAFVHALRGQN